MTYQRIGVAAHSSRTNLFGAFAGIRSVESFRQRCERWIEEHLAVRAKKSDEEEWFMKVKILGVVILAALILAVAFSASAPAAPNTASANAVPAPAPAPEPANAVPADHPEIHDAINSLRHAREHLDHAAHDFGGHRVEAIRAIDEALHQLDVCLKYDR
jgi:hypothetical protein